MIDVNNDPPELPDLLNIDYVKWPRLLVTGDQVTQEQANEIIIRTTDVNFIFSNDKSWLDTVRRELGLPADYVADYGEDADARLARHRTQWAAIDARGAELGVLDLHNMQNSRIVSAYVGGPHGWCDWDGTIGTSRYNVGKWPTAHEMHCDLTAIAAAFPYLRMQVQLLNDREMPDTFDADGELTFEYELEATAPVTWTVSDGVVAYDISPRPPITSPTNDDESIIKRFMSRDFERGVSVTRLREAVTQVDRARAALREGDNDGDQ
jgi:hypothetical protein